MASIAEGALSCTDMHGQLVLNNEMFIPGPDECMQCVCMNGHHSNCKSVLCAPPRDCHKYQVGRKCCDFTCVEDVPPITSYGDSNTDIGLRLVASAVTAVLSLALLLFLVYRLRQRRHRVPSPLRAEDTYNLTLMNYLRGSGYLGHGPGGYRGSHEFYYEEPPPPYSLWKTGSDSAGEAPPPYSEAVAAPELRQSQRREPGGRVHAVLVVAGENDRAGREWRGDRSSTLPAARRCDVVVRRPLHERPTLDQEDFPDISPPDYTVTCGPSRRDVIIPNERDSHGSSEPSGHHRGSDPHTMRPGSAHRRGHQRSQSHGNHHANHQYSQRHLSGGVLRSLALHGLADDVTNRQLQCDNQVESGEVRGQTRRLRGSGSVRASTTSSQLQNNPPDPGVEAASDRDLTSNRNCVDLGEYLTSLPSSQSDCLDHGEPITVSQCLESGEYLPPTQGHTSNGDYTTVEKRRQQCRAQAEQAMQRFSVQLALDCSDSGSSSTPTVSPECAGVGSLTSTSTENSG